MKDTLNRDIIVGDLVTYPVRQGSQMWMNVAVVQEVDTTQIKALSFRADGQRDWRVTLTSPERITIAMRGSDITDFNDIIEKLGE